MGELHDLLTMQAPRMECCKSPGLYPGEWNPWVPFGARSMEDPLRQISLCLVAPVAIQRQAQAAGVRGIIMQRPKGLEECLLASGLKR